MGATWSVFHIASVSLVVKSALPKAVWNHVVGEAGCDLTENTINLSKTKPYKYITAALN